MYVVKMLLKCSSFPASQKCRNHGALGGGAHAPSKIHNGALFKKCPFGLMKESLEVSFPHI